MPHALQRLHTRARKGRLPAREVLRADKRVRHAPDDIYILVSKAQFGAALPERLEPILVPEQALIRSQNTSETAYDII
jgi:hypothetical protein